MLRRQALVLLILVTMLVPAPVAALYEPQLRWSNGGPVVTATFNHPSSIAVDDAGNLYLADQANDRILKFTTAGAFISSWGTAGMGDGQFGSASAVAVDRSGYVYVTDSQLNRVQKFTPSGAFVGKWGSTGAGNGEFNMPADIAVSPAGDVYVIEAGGDRVQRFTSSGDFVGTWGSAGEGEGEFGFALGIAVDPKGAVYVTDHQNHTIQKFTANGDFLSVLASEGAQLGQLQDPSDLTVDAQGNVFVADTGNNRIQKFAPAPTEVLKGTAFLGDEANFSDPRDVAVDEAGRLYVLDTNAGRIYRYRAALPDTTVAGPTGLIKDPTPTFTLSSSINPATFQCRVKGSGVPFAACSTPYTTPDLDDGLNVVLVRAVDADDLKDATPFEAELRVDATRPQTYLDSGPAATTKDRTPTFAFSANERGTFQCAIDGGAFQACTSPRTTAQLSFAKHTFKVRARDRAGNVDATPAARTFTVVR